MTLQGGEFEEILHGVCALKRPEGCRCRSEPWGSVAQQSLTDEDTPESRLRSQTGVPELASDRMQDGHALPTCPGLQLPYKGDRIPLLRLQVKPLLGPVQVGSEIYS